MADAQNKLNQVAQGYMQASKKKPKNPKDDVAEPDPASAAAMSAGATVSKPKGFSYWENFKKGFK